MNKDLIRVIGSHHFPGFYHSIFDDDFYDEAKEDENEIINEFGLSEEDIEVIYEYDDFKGEYVPAVCKKYIEKFVETIIDVLPSKITEHEDFKFEIIDENNIEIFMPKEYNHRTDSCYTPIITNKKTLQMIKKHTLKLKGVDDYIIKTYRSYDGFMCLVSNNPQYWKNTAIEAYEERDLIALLDTLIALSEENIHNEISREVAEEISSICYVSPVIYYKGEKVTKKELKNKIRGE